MDASQMNIGDHEYWSLLFDSEERRDSEPHEWASKKRQFNDIVNESDPSSTGGAGHHNEGVCVDTVPYNEFYVSSAEVRNDGRISLAQITPTGDNEFTWKKESIFKPADEEMSRQILSLSAVACCSSGNYRFKCVLCDKSFNHRQHLQTHVKTVHLRIKSYQCTICSKRFGEKSALSKHHKTVHQRLRPFQCEVCFARFGQRAHLNKHLSKVNCTPPNTGTLNCDV